MHDDSSRQLSGFVPGPRHLPYFHTWNFGNPVTNASWTRICTTYVNGAKHLDIDTYYYVIRNNTHAIQSFFFGACTHLGPKFLRMNEKVGFTDLSI